jgi:hypothetical protein
MCPDVYHQMKKDTSVMVIRAENLPSNKENTAAMAIRAEKLPSV